jgi:dTDP-4-dehydrorhamnose reductase
MKILITGVNGQLGHAVYYRLKQKAMILATGHESSFFDSSNSAYRPLDITSYDDIKSVLEDFNPDYVINCAAFTNVDQCEVQKELSWKINVKGVEHLAYLSRLFHYHFIHISSDYIFDGKNGPYSENDRPNPLCYYGKQKLASENVILAQAEAYTIIRTNVLFDFYPGIKDNFVTWLVKRLHRHEKVTIVTDQWNNPTYAKDLAFIVDKIVERGIQGIYHSGSDEYMNRYEFARMIAAVGDFDQALIQPILTKDLNQLAKRPEKGGLKIDKAKKDLQFTPTPLEVAVRSVIRDMKQAGELDG